MPQIPDTFAPSVAENPSPSTALTAGRVDPMQNFAPQQEQQMGAAVSQAGQTANSIGERVQYQLDDAKTKMAESQFLQTATTVIRGDGTDKNPGYLNSRGQGALDQYSGATTALAQAKQQGLDSLSNNYQKMMYNRVTTAHLTNFSGMIGDHHFRQQTEFAIQADDQRADTYNVMAANEYKNAAQTDVAGNATGNYDVFGRVADQAFLAGQKQKIGTDDATAPQNVYGLMLMHGARTKITIANMMNNEQPAAQVQGFFDAQKAAGNIDAHDEVSLDKMVKSYVLPKQRDDGVQQAIADILNKKTAPGIGPNDYQVPITGAGFTNSPYDAEAQGVHITIPQNTPVNAPSGGTVSAVGKDDSGTPYVSIEHVDGSTSTLTGMSAFNAKVGDAIAKGQQIGTSGDEGSQTGASVLWQLADKNGNAMDPTHAGLPSVDPSKLTSEADIQAAQKLFASRFSNPDMQMQGQLMIKTIGRSNQSAVNEAATQLYKQAGDAFYSGGENWKSIPPATFVQLTPEQQQHFKDEQTDHVLRNYNQGQAFKEMGEVDQRAYFDEHPEMLTSANVDAARPKLSNGTYLSLMNRAQELTRHPEGVIEAQGINERIKYFAQPAGIDVHPLLPGGKQTLIDLTYKVNNAIDQIKAQNKGKATADQVDNAINQELIQHTTTTLRSPDNPLRFLGISPSTSTKQYQFESDPKINDTRSFPNGKTGRWDGKGWVAQ